MLRLSPLSWLQLVLALAVLAIAAAYSVDATAAGPIVIVATALCAIAGTCYHVSLRSPQRRLQAREDALWTLLSAREDR